MQETQETQARSLGQEDPLEEGHSSILGRIIPWTEEPGVPVYRLQRVGHHWSDLKVKVFQLCLTLCDPKDHRVHGIFQARILERVAFPFSRGSPQPRDQTHASCIAGGFFQQLSHEVT